MNFGNNEMMFKVIISGDSGTGKSCLVTRYLKDSFHESHQATVGMILTITQSQTNWPFFVACCSLEHCFLIFSTSLHHLALRIGLTRRHLFQYLDCQASWRTERSLEMDVQVDMEVDILVCLDEQPYVCGLSTCFKPFIFERLEFSISNSFILDFREFISLKNLIFSELSFYVQLQFLHYEKCTWLGIYLHQFFSFLVQVMAFIQQVLPISISWIEGLIHSFWPYPQASKIQFLIFNSLPLHFHFGLIPSRRHFLLALKSTTLVPDVHWQELDYRIHRIAFQKALKGFVDSFRKLFFFLGGLDSFWSLNVRQVDRWFSFVTVRGVFLFSFEDYTLASVVLLQDIGFQLQGRFFFFFCSLYCLILLFNFFKSSILSFLKVQIQIKALLSFI